MLGMNWARTTWSALHNEALRESCYPTQPLLFTCLPSLHAYPILQNLNETLDYNSNTVLRIESFFHNCNCVAHNFLTPLSPSQIAITETALQILKFKVQVNVCSVNEDYVLLV